MNFFNSFILIFCVLFLSSLAQQNSNDVLDIESQIDNMDNETIAMNELFNKNRGNLSPILITLNQHNLEERQSVKEPMKNQLAKMRLEYAKIKKNLKLQDDEQQKVIQEILKRKRSVLFDKSESDQTSDSAPEDEQNEILLAQYCTKAFLNLIPPTFCLKKPLDYGSFDIKCGEGDTEFIGLCYTPCPYGYEPKGALCSEICNSRDFYGIYSFCKKSNIDFHIKSIKARPSYSKDHTKAQCKAPKYKKNILDSNLCFNDCMGIGLTNCGPYSCRMTSQECSEAIGNIIKNILTGIGNLFLEVVTFGLSDLITSILSDPNALYNAATLAGKTEMLNVYQNVKVWLERIEQSQLVNQMTELTQNYVQNNATLNGMITQERIFNRCSSVRDIFYEKIINTNEPNDDLIDFKGNDLREYVKICKKANDGFACQQAIKQSALKWDPTGILSMLSAFKQQDCPPIS